MQRDPVLFHPFWNLAFGKLQFVDDGDQFSLRLGRARSHGRRDRSVVTFSQVQQGALLLATGGATSRQRVYPKPFVLVPETLLGRCEDELITTVPASEGGIHVPVTRADGVVLFGYISALGGAVIHASAAKEQMRRHQPWAVLSETPEDGAEKAKNHMA